MPKWWAKNEQADTNGRKGGDEHHSRRQVFCCFGFGMQVRGSKIDGRFDRGVQAFEDQYQCNCKEEDGPFRTCDMKPGSKSARNDANARLDAGVALSSKKVGKAMEGEVKRSSDSADEGHTIQFARRRVFGARLGASRRVEFDWWRWPGDLRHGTVHVTAPIAHRLPR